MKEYIDASVGIIRSTLIVELGKRIKSAVLYGTANSDDFAPGSDFDVLVSFDEVTHFDILALRKIIEICGGRGIKVDFNVHSTDELPDQSQGDFWHNNRGLLFQKEISLFGKSIIGNNPYDGSYQPTALQIQDDVIRSISSLVYRSRKVLINKILTPEQRYMIIKWVIYAASNSLAYKGVFRQKKSDIVDEFEKYFVTMGDMKKFLEYKKNPSLHIPDDILFEALNILEGLSQYFLNDRKTKQLG